MKLIGNTYKHAEEQFELKVTTCNNRVATTQNQGTGETVKFNRPKLEWMIKKGVFVQVETNDE